MASNPALYLGNPKTLQQPVLPDRLFSDVPLPDRAEIMNMDTHKVQKFAFCTAETSTPLNLSPRHQFISPGVSYFLPETMIPSNRVVAVLPNPAEIPFNETRASMEKVWVDTSCAWRDSVVTSLNMKNQWRDNMLHEAPLRTFGGGTFKTLSNLPEDQMSRQPCDSTH